jgi:hypothetical protein
MLPYFPTDEDRSLLGRLPTERLVAIVRGTDAAGALHTVSGSRR